MLALVVVGSESLGASIGTDFGGSSHWDEIDHKGFEILKYLGLKGNLLSTLLEKSSGLRILHCFEKGFLPMPIKTRVAVRSGIWS